jgi:hypothetical protein
LFGGDDGVDLVGLVRVESQAVMDWGFTAWLDRFAHDSIISNRGATRQEDSTEHVPR